MFSKPLQCVLGCAIAVAGIDTSPAFAGDTVAYIGPVVCEPEKDTFAMRQRMAPVVPLAILGPATFVGSVEADAEKNTFASFALPESDTVRRQYRGRSQAPGVLPLGRTPSIENATARR